MGSFDLVMAVMFPMIVLGYCYGNFQMDRELIKLNMKVLPAGSDETHANSLVDPVQIALFRVNFDSLRIQSATQFLIRISMNLSFCYRLKRIVDIFVENSVRGRSKSVAHTSPAPVIRQRSVPRFISLLFQAYAVLLLVLVSYMIQSSQAACTEYPDCVVFAYRWPSAANATCPCTAMIDVNKAPTLYDEWIDPPDATEKVKKLAIAGELRVLQLINRRLVTWPDELRQSTKLQHMYVSVVVLLVVSRLDAHIYA